MKALIGADAWPDYRTGFMQRIQQGQRGWFSMAALYIAEDWGVLFRLLQEDQIKPVIAERFALQDVVEANELLQSGQVTGNIVILPQLEPVSTQPLLA